jgi:hypothetical protein
MLVGLQVNGVPAFVPNLTVLLPWEVPKLVPVIVTAVPTPPEVGEMLVMAGVTVNSIPLLAMPPTVTTTFPVVTPVGAGATIFPDAQLVGVVVVPLNVTVLVEPCVEPKRLPLMVTDVFAGPFAGEILVITGADVSVNVIPLLCNPLTTTTTGPVVTLLGAETVMLVAVQLEGPASSPLNKTALVLWVEPKFVPVMVTACPGGPDVTDRLVMLGTATTVNKEITVGTPPAVTVT